MSNDLYDHVGGLPSLRRERIVRAVREIIAAVGHRTDAPWLRGPIAVDDVPGPSP